MIFLHKSETLEVVLNEHKTTEDMSFLAHWRDMDVSTCRYGRTIGLKTNGTLPVIMVGNPCGYQRIINDFVVHNSDIATKTVAIRLNTNISIYTLWLGALSVGDSLHYDCYLGFRKVNNLGTPLCVALSNQTKGGSEPRNNDGRQECFWCFGTKTERRGGGMYDVCPRCEK